MSCRGDYTSKSFADCHRCQRNCSSVGYVWRELANSGRTVVKTKIHNVMIVTKARDHSLVQLTRELAEWLMTSPRHGKSYGVRVYVDAKLEKSKRFDADGIYKDHEIVGEKNLLKYWTPESCVF